VGACLASFPANAQNHGAVHLVVGQILVGTVATQVVPLREYRIRVTLTNGTNNNVWCGPDSTVTATTGDVLQGTTNQGIGSHKDIDYQGDIWCVATNPSVISFSEIY
jgi:hypothetical protein